MATVSNEIKCYFEKLIEPLVTNKSLEDLLNKLKNDLLKKSSNLSYQFMKTQLISL